MSHSLEEILFVLALPSTAEASVLVVIIGCALTLHRNHVSSFWKHILWILVAVSLLLPQGPGSRFSWKNWNQESIKEAVIEPSIPRVNAVAAGENDTAPSDSIKDQPLLISTPAPIGSRGRWSFPYEMTWKSIIALIWGTVACGLIFTYLAKSILFRQRVLTEISEEGFERSNAVLKRLIGKRRFLFRPRLCVTRAIHSPALLGIIQPRILLPPDIATESSEEQLQHIIMHELAHVRRQDVMTSCFFALAVAAHWFNPLIWWAYRKFRIEAERATDAAVLAKLGQEQAESYGISLLAILERNVPLSSSHQSAPGAVAIAEKASDLRERVRLIAQFQEGRLRRGATISLVLITAIVAVTFTEAQRDDAASEKEIFQFQVIDTEGLPVDGARVYALSDYGWDFTSRLVDSASTNGEGIAQITIPNSENPTPILAVSDLDEIGASSIYNGQEPSDPILIVLSSTDSLRVRIIDDSGKPVPDLLLFAEGLTSLNRFPTHFPLLPEKGLRAITDKNGRCTFLAIPEIGRAYLNHQDKRFAQLLSKEQLYTWHAPGEKEVTIRLQKGFVAEGKLLLPDGTPAEGGRVIFREKESLQKEGNVMNSSITDSEGRFSVPNLRQGNYTVNLGPPNEMTDKLCDSVLLDFEISETAQLNDLKFSLREGGLLRGQVIVPDGAPAPIDIHIMCNTPDWPDFQTHSSQTDSEGRYSLRIPAGTNKIYTNKTFAGIHETQKPKQTIRIKDGQTIEMNFKFTAIADAPNTVSGRVLDASGAPVETIIFMGTGKEGGNMRGPGTYRSNAAGEFAISIPEEEGRYYLCSPSSAWVEMIPGKANIQLLPPEQASSLKGRVIDPKGNPVRGIPIHAESLDHISMMFRLQGKPVISGNDGKFLVPWLPPGDAYRVSGGTNPIGGGEKAITKPGETLDLGDLVYD